MVIRNPTISMNTVLLLPKTKNIKLEESTIWALYTRISLIIYIYIKVVPVGNFRKIIIELVWVYFKVPSTVPTGTRKPLPHAAATQPNNPRRKLAHANCSKTSGLLNLMLPTQTSACRFMIRPNASIIPVNYRPLDCSFMPILSCSLESQ